jgi:hypothetical protein
LQINRQLFSGAEYRLSLSLRTSDRRHWCGNPFPRPFSTDCRLSCNCQRRERILTPIAQPSATKELYGCGMPLAGSVRTGFRMTSGGSRSVRTTASIVGTALIHPQSARGPTAPSPRSLIAAAGRRQKSAYRIHLFGTRDLSFDICFSLRGPPSGGVRDPRPCGSQPPGPEAFR